MSFWGPRRTGRGFARLSSGRDTDDAPGTRAVVISEGVLWTTGILSLASLMGADAALGQRPVLAAGIAGGLLFGVGAALNGACSFSTISRLAEGHVVMLFTLAGWAISIAIFTAGWPDFHPSVPSVHVSGALAIPFVVWMARELSSLWRRLGPIAEAFRAGFWAMSPAALLISLANSTLILVDRPWSFTSTALCSAGAIPIAPCRHAELLWMISGPALLAMIASARLRGAFRVRRLRLGAAARHLLAGLAMGAGASLIPGEMTVSSC